MKTLLLAFGIAAFAVPALAQTTYEDEIPPSQSEPAEPDVDNTTTGSIQSDSDGDTSAGLRLDQSTQRGNQGDFFGANGR